MTKTWADASSDAKLDDEAGRQCALDRTGILDTEREEAFESITGLVRTVLEVPIAAVSLIDRDRQWFKSIKGLEAAQTTRNVAFCDHAIRARGCTIVPDATQDLRFRDNPYVTGEPGIRAYIGAPITTPDGYNLGTLCAIDTETRDFTDEQAKILTQLASLVMNEIELRKVAERDVLTGLATRRAFDEAAEAAIGQSRRSTDEVALVLFDLDHFKRINDTHGHCAGDAVLSAVGRLVSRTLRKTDFAGRIGGEEFAVLMYGLGKQEALMATERLRKEIEQEVAPDYPGLSFTASFGVAVLEPRHATPEVWIEAADAALYNAKRSGRNRIGQGGGISDVDAA